MKRLAVLLVLLVTAAGLPALTAPAAVAATPTAGQSLYVPLPPVRLLDTRDGRGAPRRPVGAGEVLDLLVADGSRVPASATAVLLNVTATRATAGTDVRVYPTGGGAVPTVSNLNVVPGLTVANLVTVKVGPDGRVRLRNENGAVDLIADLSGYTTTAGGGSSYVPAPAPVRLLDTRTTRTPLGPTEARPLDVRRTADGAASGVPDGASAVVLNVTAVGPTSTTDVRAYPQVAGGGVPVVSNLNATRGRTVPNLVVVAVGDLSRVVLRNQAGSTHLLADLAGWYVPGDAGAAFHPVDPVRLLDTRATGGVRLGAGESRRLQVAGLAKDGVGPVPAQASALVLNVTAVAPSATSDVRVFPTSGGGVPVVSNLNVVRGQTVPNSVVVTVGRDGAVQLYNNGGTVDLVVDLAGWFAPTGDGWDISWPQCTTRGATTSNLPTGGAFSVVGLNRGTPFTDNECFAAQWQWASSLPGEPSVYLNTNAPGSSAPQWTAPGPKACTGASSDKDCAYNYGWALATYAVERIPLTPSGGRPFVWFDVENGPVWQNGADNPSAVAVNREVLNGAAARLRESGHRYGVYADRTSAGRDNDWVQIMGQFRLDDLPVWVFRAQTADPVPQCAPSESITGGPVQLVQVQPTESGLPYDVNHLC